MASAEFPWLQATLSGVFVLRGADQAGFDQIVRWAASNYRGPNFGGLDLMPPNENKEAWIFLGRWTDCFTAEVKAAAEAFQKTLNASVDVLNVGIEGGSSSLTVSYPPEDRVEVIPWIAYLGGVAIRWWEWPSAERARLEQSVFPALPRWIGTRNEEPHWLGTGLQKDAQGRFTSITPYAKLRFVPGAGIEFSGMASAPDYQAWLSSLRAATRWF